MPVSDQQPRPPAPGGAGGPRGPGASAVLPVGQERLWFLDRFEPVFLRTLSTHRTCAAFAEAVEAALPAGIDALSDAAAEVLPAAQNSPEGSRPLS
ncbi:hypothetical protein ACFYPN_30850 [Streptomyces sp. NPDC005576]|uniref:hypothetical protein n=1 Tax=unclassified Streptomyces TaxID=2593676 RepID=UPI0033D5C5C3